MTIEIWTVDAFAANPFEGNPAAVCILPEYLDDETLQKIAMELNLSETAFLVKKAALDYDLRWFTPSTEVNLCGHATLAATHMLSQSGIVRAGESVTYRTLSGDLRARALEGEVELDFPELAGKPVPPHAALSSLGVNILACESNRDNYLVEVKDYKTLVACAPDMRRLAGIDKQGVIVTANTGVDGFDFASRYFGPNCGIDEDPVTGSAHCFLAPYWEKRLGKNRFHAVQASKRRGVLDITLAQGRVLMAGKAITMMKGRLQVSPAAPKEKAA